MPPAKPRLEVFTTTTHKPEQLRQAFCIAAEKDTGDLLKNNGNIDQECIPHASEGHFHTLRRQ
jgi:hypothetical protein